MSRQQTTQQDGALMNEAPGPKLLKAERVQEELTAKVDSRLKAERVQVRLKEMPGWRLLKGGRGIDRVKELGSAEGAADYAGFVLRQAARDQQVTRVELQGSRVLLAVFAKGRSGGRSGLTTKQLDFAAALG
ncbi:MAG TPA: hypothetical protein VH988_07185 [Thermoanaerobaculia bacterium]|jgi:hypothetical protein|nr:hypothetical protein [Thermoanaerobaculia bacterium]